MSAPRPLPPKMMLGFVVRQCAVALGRAPTADELAEWANNQGEGRQRYCLFGRPISVEEARVILHHPGRPVTVRNAGARPLYALAPSGGGSLTPRSRARTLSPRARRRDREDSSD